jgi:hypothetical protein
MSCLAVRSLANGLGLRRWSRSSGRRRRGAAAVGLNNEILLLDFPRWLLARGPVPRAVLAESETVPLAVYQGRHLWSAVTQPYV